MAAITRREVAAGRMAADDGMHKLALAADAVMAGNPLSPDEAKLFPPSEPASPKSIWARIASWFK
jgi:hypothetical protein